jgi:hypothetical protein
MPWKIDIYFYLSLGFSLCGFIFPTHVSQAIGFDIGDMVHWIYGYYILIPRNPTGEIELYNNSYGPSYFFIFITIIFLVVSFVELRSAKRGNRYDKNLIYVIAFIQLMASIIYLSSEFVVIMLSIWGFIFSALFALIGNKELNLFYIDKGIVNVKKERKLGVVLITISLIFLVYIISEILRLAVLFSIDVFSRSFASIMYPALILLLIMLFYGINSLIRAKNKNRSKLQL